MIAVRCARYSKFFRGTENLVKFNHIQKMNRVLWVDLFRNNPILATCNECNANSMRNANYAVFVQNRESVI